MIVVSNSGPIISFARAGCLDLLRQTFQEIIIPEAVYHDIVIQGRNRPGAKEVDQADWIKREAVKNKEQADQLPFRLGLGEREAIVLAQQLKALLLIDDRQARKEAEKRGLTCLGSLRVLKEAKGRGFITNLEQIGDRLIRAGLRVKNSIYQKFLQTAG